MRAISKLALDLVLALPLGASGQISIAMPTVENGGVVVNWSGPSPNTVAWAQTFVAPDSTHTRLDHVDLAVSQNSLISDFAAYVVQWNSTSLSLSGAPLWTSPIQSTLSLPAYPSYGVVSLDTGGIDLQPGLSYALVVFDSTPIAYSNEGARVGLANATSLDGSAFVFTRGAPSASFSDLYAATVSAPAFDLAFGATFSASGLTAVPEPATAVLGLGFAFIVGLVALRLHQRRRAAATTGPSAA